MGLHSETKAKIENCLKEKISSGRIAKDSVLNAQDIHNACAEFGIDPRTAESHMPGIVGLGVEGPDFKGNIVEFIPDEGPWVKVDPPAATRKEGSGQTPQYSWADVAVAGLAAGVGLLAIGITVAAAKRNIFICDCQTQIDLTEWRETAFSCPSCERQYVMGNS